MSFHSSETVHQKHLRSLLSCPKRTTLMLKTGRTFTCLYLREKSSVLYIQLCSNTKRAQQRLALPSTRPGPQSTLLLVWFYNLLLFLPEACNPRGIFFEQFPSIFLAADVVRCTTAPFLFRSTADGPWSHAPLCSRRIETSVVKQEWLGYGLMLMLMLSKLH